MTIGMLGGAMLLVTCCTTPVLSETDNPYIQGPVGDTLTVLLPSYENDRCELIVRDGGSVLRGTEVVSDGKIQLEVRSLPAGKHVAWLRVGDLFTGVRFIKR